MNEKGNELLMVFIKNPVIGKIKTRLAATIGNHAALAIYQQVLEHTLQITSRVKVGKMVFYSDFIMEKDSWAKNGFLQHVQVGTALGEKMQNAFHLAFNNEYNKVIIIGSDCFELTTEVLNLAFEKLNECDVVIGPAEDGGYYLLGMNRLYADFFINKMWSSASVYADTLQDIHNLGVSSFILPVLNDIDEEKDLPSSLRLLYK